MPCALMAAPAELAAPDAAPETLEAASETMGPAARPA